MWSLIAWYHSWWGLTFIAKLLRPISCALFAILQKEMPWTPGTRNLSEIFRATSSSSENREWEIKYIEAGWKITECGPYFCRGRLYGMPNARESSTRAVSGVSQFEWPNRNAFGIPIDRVLYSVSNDWICEYQSISLNFGSRDYLSRDLLTACRLGECLFSGRAMHSRRVKHDKFWCTHLDCAMEWTIFQNGPHESDSFAFQRRIHSRPLQRTRPLIRAVCSLSNINTRPTDGSFPIFI